MSKLPQATVYQGDTVRLQFQALTPQGSPENLVGCRVRWALSDPGSISSPVLTKSSDEEGDMTIVDAAAGRLIVNIAAGELDTPGQYVQELEITLPSGETYTYGQGPFIVKPAVLPEQA